MTVRVTVPSPVPRNTRAASEGKTCLNPQFTYLFVCHIGRGKAYHSHLLTTTTHHRVATDVLVRTHASSSAERRLNRRASKVYCKSSSVCGF